jgi:hypothetical protein
MMDSAEFGDSLNQSADKMLNAANRLTQAVDKHDDAMASFIQFMDSWADRLEAVMDRHKNSYPEGWRVYEANDNREEQ